MSDKEELPPPLPPPIPRKLDPAPTTALPSVSLSPVPFYALSVFASVMVAVIAGAAAWGIIVLVRAITGWDAMASYMGTTLPLIGLSAMVTSFGAVLPEQVRKFLKKVAAFLVLMPLFTLVRLLIGNGSLNAAWAMWLLMNAASGTIAAITWGAYAGLAVYHYGKPLRQPNISNS